MFNKTNNAISYASGEEIKLHAASLITVHVRRRQETLILWLPLPWDLGFRAKNNKISGRVVISADDWDDGLRGKIVVVDQLTNFSKVENVDFLLLKRPKYVLEALLSDDALWHALAVLETIGRFIKTSKIPQVSYLDQTTGEFGLFQADDISTGRGNQLQAELAQRRREQCKHKSDP